MMQTLVSVLEKRPVSPGRSVLVWYATHRPQELLALLADLSPTEVQTETGRAQHNLAALRRLSELGPGVALLPADRRVLLSYSGWGGIRLKRLKAELASLPPDLHPDPVALIHEYYTPLAVARAVAAALTPLLPALAHEGVVNALEPSVGIGRFVQAFQMERLPQTPRMAWQAVEMSPLSARILRALWPEVQVHQTSFEAWVEEHGATWYRKLRLIVSNPPYGVRGATTVLDSNRRYREGLLGSRAYLYFLKRSLDLLAPGGLGVYLIPYGLLSGTGDLYVQLRRELLRHHHLACAYRLPSKIFPGANLVTDLVFFRARGGALRAVLPEDEAIAQGRYFDLEPGHILGEEVGRGGEEDDQTKKPRWGYEVRGAFAGLPAFAERPLCDDCPLDAVRSPVRASTQRSEAPSDYVTSLGRRVSTYLKLVAEGDPQTEGLHLELRQALRDFAASSNPRTRPDLVRRRQEPDVVAVLSAYQPDGTLLETLETAPVPRQVYRGSKDVVEMARSLRRRHRQLPLARLVAWQKEHGGSLEAATVETSLLRAGWCLEGPEKLVWPESDYYTGSLWPKYDQARRLGEAGDPQQSAQADRLLRAIGPKSFVDIGAEPRAGWIPTSVLSAWVTHAVQAPEALTLVRREGLVQSEGTLYTNLSGEVWRTHAKTFAGWERKLRVLLGYLNHDLHLFRPDVDKKWNEERNREETAGEALDRTRLEFAEQVREQFSDWLLSHDAERASVTEAYNRTYRGFVPPSFEETPLDLARWQNVCPLHSYQNQAVRRVVQNHGGLVAHGVGLGKTRMGVAALALARQMGKAHRAVVLVQNSKVLDWLAEFACGLPDYRVEVIGAAPKTVTRGARKGESVWETDSPEDRADKWRRFQAGEFDAVILTYSMFDRTLLRPERIETLLQENTAVQREMALDARALLESLQSSARDASLEPSDRDSPEQAQRKEHERAERRRLKALLTLEASERNQAIAREAQLRFIAEKTEPPPGIKPDPGIFWEDLGIDWMTIDEAQNFKNLFTASPREGGTPQYLGAQSDSARAWQAFFRCVDVQTRGGAVVLLSATPAKNSPLEFFSLYSLLDRHAFARYGVLNAEQFIDRYLHMERRLVQGTDLEIESRLVVAGFQRLDELREIIYRYGDYRTADEVGLDLPDKTVEQVRCAMDPVQDRKYEQLLAEYEKALQSMRGGSASGARFQILKILVRMALVALHPALDDPPSAVQEDGTRKGWQWEDWELCPEMHAPKLDRCAAKILETPRCGHLVFVDNVVVHRWMRQVLVDEGMDPARIGILNAKAAPRLEQRTALAAAFNGSEEKEPSLDVLLCNQIAYEGLNLQRRTCAIHHLDLPWEPATLEQRNGRGDRQGNTSDTLHIYYYLTERSMDMARFALITGKRGWMVTLLSSMDRETNNPGAQMQMSPEELLTYISRDPTRTQAILEEQRLARQEQARVATLKESWRNLRALYARRVEAHQTTDLTQKAILETAISGIAENLRRVDPSVWPWALFVDPMLSTARPAFLFAAGGMPGCVYEGGSYVHLFENGTPAPYQSFQLGRMARRRGELVMGFRRMAEPGWQMLRAEAVAEVFTHTQPEGWRRPWPLEEPETQEATQRMIADLVWSGSRGYADLHLDLAPEAWRARFWERYGGPLLRALARAGGEIRVPGKLAGMLGLYRGQDLTRSDIDWVPFTQQGYEAFLADAPTSPVPAEDLRAALRWWWGAVPPRDFLAAPLRTLEEAEEREQADRALLEGVRPQTVPPRPPPSPPSSPVSEPRPTGGEGPDGRFSLLDVSPPLPPVFEPQGTQDTRLSLVEVDAASPSTSAGSLESPARMSLLEVDDPPAVFPSPPARIEVTVQGQRLGVTAPKTEAFRQWANANGGSWDRAQRLWTFPASMVQEVRGALTGLYGTDGPPVPTVRSRLVLTPVFLERNLYRWSGGWTLSLHQELAHSTNGRLSLAPGVRVLSGQIPDVGAVLEIEAPRPLTPLLGA